MEIPSVNLKKFGPYIYVNELHYNNNNNNDKEETSCSKVHVGYFKNNKYERRGGGGT